MTSTVIASPSSSPNLSHIFINRDYHDIDQFQQTQPTTRASTSMSSTSPSLSPLSSPTTVHSPLRSPLFTSPTFLDPLLSQLLYIQTTGCTGVAGPRLPNEYTTSEGSLALTTSRHPPKVKKVSFANIITTNEGDAYIIPPGLRSPSSDGSTESGGSLASSTGSLGSVGSSRSSVDEGGVGNGSGQIYWTHPTREARGKGGPIR